MKIRYLATGKGQSEVIRIADRLAPRERKAPPPEHEFRALEVYDLPRELVARLQLLNRGGFELVDEPPPQLKIKSKLKVESPKAEPPKSESSPKAEPDKPAKE